MGFLLKKKKIEMGQSLILRCWGNCCILYCLISIISGKSVFLLCNVFSDIFRICFTQMLDRTGSSILCGTSCLWFEPHLPLSHYLRTQTKKKKRIYRESKWRNKFVLWWFSQRVVLGETVRKSSRFASLFDHLYFYEEFYEVLGNKKFSL